ERLGRSQEADFVGQAAERGMDFARAGERPERRARSAPAAQPGDGISNQFLRQDPAAHGYFQPQRWESITRSNFLRFPPALNKNAEFGNSAAPRRTFCVANCS